MKKFTNDDLKQIYKNRRAKLAKYLIDNNTGACVFIDSEEHREPAVRYYCGHTSDCVLIIYSDGYSVLVPWDENLAKKISFTDKMIPYTRYKNSDLEAVKSVMNACYTHGETSKIELPPYLTYPHYLKFLDALANYDCRCKEDGAHKFTVDSRMVKDEYEIECTKEAARVGDLIIEKIENGIDDGSIKTEMDVSLLIERELRLNGCERNGFDTLAAGSSRSFEIHAFPGYTSAPWPGKGLSILDFGVVFEGYTSDTTLTVVKDATDEQKKLVELVEKAAKEALPYYKNGEKIKMAGLVDDEVLKKEKREMPHK